MDQAKRLAVIYETAASMITRTPEAWADFLTFAARVHKYPFDNALLAYAQDRNATMLATEAVWQRVGRSPIDHARQIAVCQYSKAGETLKYLLDVSQTHGPALPQTWKIEESMQTSVALALAQRYHTGNPSPYMGDAIALMVHMAMAQGFSQAMHDFELDIQGHFFSELPQEGLYTQVREIVEASARILISARCGLTPRDTDIRALETISHYDTIPLIARLGSITMQTSKSILAEIEQIVKIIEQERSDTHGEEIESGIYRERWPAVSEYQHGERGHRDNRAVRPPVDGEYAPEPPAALYDPADAGQADRIGPEGGRRSAGAPGTDLPAEPDGQPSPADRGHTGEGPASEQPAPGRGGSGDAGNRDDAPVIPTENMPDEKEPQGSFSFADTLSDDEIREGYERILTSADLYPAELYISIRNRLFMDDSWEDKGYDLHAIYQAFGGDAETEIDGVTYRTAMRGEDGADGMSFYIGEQGYTYLPWSTIAHIIDTMIEDGDYPDPMQDEERSLNDRIGAYNIPDEIDDMGMPDAEASMLSAPVPPTPNLDTAMRDIAEYLTRSEEMLGENWQYETAAEIYKENPSPQALYTLFQQLSKQALTLEGGQTVTCNAFPAYVAFHVNGFDCNLTYDQLGDLLKHHVELGGFAGDMADTVNVLALVVPPDAAPYTATYRKGDGSLVQLFDLSGGASIAIKELEEGIHAVYGAGAAAEGQKTRSVDDMDIPGAFVVVRTQDSVFVSLTAADIAAYQERFALTSGQEVEQETGELYPYLEALLCHPFLVSDGWSQYLAEAVSSESDSAFALSELFQEIDENTYPVLDGFVECFAFQDGVTVRINGSSDLDFTYEEMGQYVRSLMEIGDFPPLPDPTAEPPLPEAAGETEREEIRVLVVPPDQMPYAASIAGTYDAMRLTVDPSGYSGVTIYEVENGIDAVCMDDVPEDEPINRSLDNGLTVRGNFVIARVDDHGQRVSLTDVDVEKYSRIFSQNLIDLTAHLAEKERRHQEAEAQAEQQRQEREQGLEGALYPFHHAKGQPDISKLEEPELPYDPADFVEIMDIPRFDEIDTFVPQPKVVDFHSAIGQKPRESGEVQQLSFLGFADNDVPDASFDLDADAAEDEPQDMDTGEQSEAAATDETRQRQQRVNYRYSEADDLYPPGAKAKYRNNIEAIKLLKQIEVENRMATADEQKSLARYVGWGGLSGAFDPKAQDWQQEYEELRLLLDEGEYNNARDSILTAYYTPPELVRVVYGALEQFGLTDGTRRSILDPACGSGNFTSAMPEGLEKVRVTAIDIDSISARISRQLQQRNKVIHSGFETSGVKDNSFDAVVGNVPFNDIKVYDRKYKDTFYVHDYFLVKSLDALKPGGIAALITSKGSMDKEDMSARMEMARRADLIGAIRLPNNTFKALAGTEVTTDILFFQKLPKERVIRDMTQVPEWVQTRYSPDHRLIMNSYFVAHPEMMLGDMRQVSGRFGPTPECIAPERQELGPLLGQAISRLDAKFTAAPDEIVKPKVRVIQGEQRETLEAPDGVRMYTYHIKDGALYYCSDGQLIPQDHTGKRLMRIKGLCGIRDALQEVIRIQSYDYDPKDLEAAQAVLNQRYDAFRAKHDHINSRGNALAFGDDDTFPLLRSIEDYDKDTDTWSKAPIFTRATIRPRRIAGHAETALQALQICLNLKQRVDIPLMARLYGKDADTVIAELGDKIYLNPQKYYGNPHEGWELDEEYLSGYVCDKLAYATLKAEEYPDLFTRNVEALRAVQPKPLLPGEIEYSIGSPWIPIWYYDRFMYEILGTYAGNQGKDGRNIYVEYMEYTNQWYVANKGAERDNVKVHVDFGTDRINAYEILEQTLNLQSVTIRDPVKYRDENGKEKVKYVINPKDTMVARGKQQQMRDAFKSWLFADHTRSEELLKLYNEKFNNVVPRTYDGSFLIFPGMSDEVELRPHQYNVAARIIFNGTALMAHEVGAGKTAAMIAAGMYMKHYGLLDKPIYVVPNHIIDQWANEFLRFFPAARLLITSESDFEKKNRQRFVGKIAMGEYDGIIISHSQYEKIMVSRERQEKLLTGQINHLTFVVEKMKEENGQNWSIKQIVAFQKNLKVRLERLLNTDAKDDLISFEDLGIDYQFVDEAHQFKNNFTYTKIRNVAGISNANSQRAADMKLKCDYLLEEHNGRGVTFATGTPVSNTLAELFIMQMYLQPQELKRRGIDFFDNWASTFAQIVTGLEITPEGTGYRMRSRFAKFQNLPELMSIFWLVADIQTEEMLGLPTPEIEGGKPYVVQTECSPFQKEIIESYVGRSEDIRTGKVKPEQDNMLKLTHEARLLAIDPRLLYPNAPNDPNSKLNTCIRNIYDIWQETAESRATQILFCDVGTPKPGQFNVYDEVKALLMEMKMEIPMKADGDLFVVDEDEILMAEAAKGALLGKGVPAEEIAFIHDCKTDAQREALFEKVRSGEVRILLGSTQKLGMGTNVQDRLLAIHHLDCPWRPTDITQRNGRGKRQGNMHPIIRIFNYVTKGTFDSYLWQIQEQKLRYITQVMSGKSISRSCEDVDITVLNAAQVKAIATDNPLLLEKMTAENEVTRLTILRNAWQNERTLLERRIEHGYPRKIRELADNAAKIRVDMETVKAHPTKGDLFHITLGEKVYDERARAGQLLTVRIKALMARTDGIKDEVIGTFRGLELSLHRTYGFVTLVARGAMGYQADMGDSELGNITRLENLLNDLRSKLTEQETQRGNIEKQLETAKIQVTQPFAHEQELNEHSKRLTEINTKLEFKELADDDVVMEDETESGDAAQIAAMEPAIVR